ncbi:hypothetical protein AQ490_03465 [Wenjunlia vitaminophila]|uniref:Uncharacterized protein n=1 Tax=Wenjunlia vitaminophila TaxID=76728 RepID=A0A0T6LT84_WENVI|nr:hypothetical protein [Wenjunlia vitaminophila]KRV49269.1 hypothetical protein AQ490_03465 [Wenjunlia vitaminophila]
MALSRGYAEDVEVHGKWPVHYQFRAAKGDHKNLLVVFSSVGSRWGFGNALDGIQCNVLRIRDYFDGAASYYVARNMDFSVSESVEALIRSFMERLGVTRDQVTLAGSSKGGSAALYYGLKYDYKNIVMSTPQYFLGSYSHGHGDLGRYVLGEGEPMENVKIMDSVIPDVLQAEKDFDRNIYLVSCEADYQYEQEVKHYLPALRKYENFNLVLVESPTLRRHEEVTRHALPVLWSIIHALTEGVVLHWGQHRVGPGPDDPAKAAEYLAELRRRDTALAILKKITVNDRKVHLSGHAFLPGVPPEGEVEERKRLVLEQNGRTWVFPLETVKVLRLYRDYYEKYFCEYAEGGFSSGSDSISFDALPLGSYDVSVWLSSEREGIERRTRLISQVVVDTRFVSQDAEIMVRGGRGGLRVIKRSVVGEDSDTIRFTVEDSWVRERVAHAEGVFFLPGRNADKFAHASYYLVLQGKAGTYSFPLVARRNAKPVRARKSPDDVGNYDFGYYTSPKGEGVDVSEVPAGRYTMLVSMSAGGALYTKKAGRVTLRRTS